jgi:hypothetical protein
MPPKSRKVLQFVVEIVDVYLCFWFGSDVRVQHELFFSITC